MPAIPRDAAFDVTRALLADPYRFISKRCQHYGADLVSTRIMLRQTICMTGPSAAALFYDNERFSRAGAAPEPVRATLFGKGGVQGLDGAAHRHRKAMFMSLVTAERISELARVCAEQWVIFSRRWATAGEVTLYDELHQLLTRAVCAWAGVPLAESEVSERTRELVAMFDKAGSVGPAHLWSRIARKRAERWIAQLVRQIRTGQFEVPTGSAAQVIALHRDLHGALLEPRIAAVEILNVLRPIVANAVFIVFAAHALHMYPEVRRRLGSDANDAESFAQEVRRFYPFFPSVIARTRCEFEWSGYQFPASRRVMLDLYGTNHDVRAWEAPDQFRPDRFRSSPQPFAFVPQGGGDYHTNHRCPGEGISIQLLKLAVNFLVRRLRYQVPEQDLSIQYSRLPALPVSRFVISHVKTAD